MVFNPVLLKLKQMEDRYGYKLHNGDITTSIITLPYADDFCLITSDLRAQRKIIADINNSINSMGMKLKPSKCRSLSLCSGKATDTPFFIGDHRIPSIKDEEQKFLGKLLFFSGKSEDTFNLIHDTLNEALGRIEASLVRAEYKLWMLKHYLLQNCSHFALNSLEEAGHFCGQIHQEVGRLAKKCNQCGDTFRRSA